MGMGAMEVRFSRGERMESTYTALKSAYIESQNHEVAKVQNPIKQVIRHVQSFSLTVEKDLSPIQTSCSSDHHIQ